MNDTVVFKRAASLGVLAISLLLLASSASAGNDGEAGLLSSSGVVGTASDSDDTAEFAGVSDADLGLLPQPGGGAGPEAQIGRFDGNQVRNPWKGAHRGIVFLAFTNNADEAKTCTGFLIGPSTVATAGYCVHQGSNGGDGFFAEASYAVTAGKSGPIEPFEACGATQLHTSVAFGTSNDPAQAWGAITLDCNIGQTLGWYGITHKGDPKGRGTLIAGYLFGRNQTQWFGFGGIVDATSNQLWYNIDTGLGMGGSPVFQYRTLKCNHCAIGVHAYGPGQGGPGLDKYNVGVKFDAAAIALLKGLL